MKLINAIRNIFKIRTQRQPTSPGPMPQIGSSIVLDNLRIKLKYPINIEQWHWFSKLGWRAVDMRTNQRKYICIPDNVLVKLMDATGPGRDELYQRLVVMRDENDVKQDEEI